MVVLATMATVIASQAVISGAFSVSRQAVRLGFLPHLTVRHTSTSESGQIYVPAVNWLLFGGVLVLMVGVPLVEQAGHGLRAGGDRHVAPDHDAVPAPGRVAWRWARWQLIVVGVVFGGVELTYFAANLTKVVHGGWLPLLIAAVVVTVMTTWQRGRKLVTERRVELEGPLEEFVEELHDCSRSPGCRARRCSRTRRRRRRRSRCARTSSSTTSCTSRS